MSLLHSRILILIRVAFKMYLLSLIRLHLKALKPYVSFVFKIPLSMQRKESRWRLFYVEKSGI